MKALESERSNKKKDPFTWRPINSGSYFCLCLFSLSLSLVVVLERFWHTFFQNWRHSKSYCSRYQNLIVSLPILMKSECNFFGLRLEEQTFPHNAQCIPTHHDLRPKLLKLFAQTQEYEPKSSLLSIRNNFYYLFIILNYDYLISNIQYCNIGWFTPM